MRFPRTAHLSLAALSMLAASGARAQGAPGAGAAATTAASGAARSLEQEAAVLVLELCSEAWAARDAQGLTAVEGRLATPLAAVLGEQGPIAARLRSAFDEMRSLDSSIKGLQARRGRLDGVVEAARASVRGVHEEILGLFSLLARVRELDDEIGRATIDTNYNAGVIERKRAELGRLRRDAQQYQQEHGSLDVLEQQRARFLGELDAATGDPSYGGIETGILAAQKRLAEVRRAVASDKLLLRASMARLAALSAVQASVRTCIEETRRELAAGPTPTPVVAGGTPPPPPAGDDGFQEGDVRGKYRATCTGPRYGGQGTQTGIFRISIEPSHNVTGFFTDQSSANTVFVSGSYGPSTRQAGGKLKMAAGTEIGTWKATIARSGSAAVRTANGTFSIRYLDGSGCDTHFWAPADAPEPAP